MRKFVMKEIFTVLVFLLSAAWVSGQNTATGNEAVKPAAETELYEQIYFADSAMFYAFNHCDSVQYRKYLSDDLEFYHDLGGLHYLAEEMQSITEMCARHSNIRRELVKGTLEVYKLGNAGALQMGIHRIYHTNPGQTEHLSGEYKFIQVWEKKDASWKVKRIISYGHGKMNNN